jgi:hypothetical protein
MAGNSSVSPMYPSKGRTNFGVPPPRINSRK